MPPWFSLVGYFLASVSTLMAVWLASRFSWLRYQNERIWDRKADAYGLMLESLHDLAAWFEAEMRDESKQREQSEAVVAERVGSYSDARKNLRRVAGREMWLLDLAVSETMEALNKELDGSYESWFENLDAGGFAVKQAIRRLTALAQGELRTGRTR